MGRAFRRRAGASSDHYIFTDITSDPTLDTVWLDVTNPDAVRLICASERIDIIINCAAFTDVDKAEQDLRMAELLNLVAPGYLADIARERNALLIHFSTDRIFRGEIPIPIREDFPAAPSGAFGVTKLQGEEAIRNSGCRAVIIRTSWLYSPEGDNFMTRMKGLTMQRKKLKVVYDQVGSPTRAADLADAVFLPEGTDYAERELRADLLRITRLARYYALKLRAAVLLLQGNREQAGRNMREAAEHWRVYADETARWYRPKRLSRLRGVVSPDMWMSRVERDEWICKDRRYWNVCIDE